MPTRKVKNISKEDREIPATGDVVLAGHQSPEMPSDVAKSLAEQVDVWQLVPVKKRTARRGAATDVDDEGDDEGDEFAMFDEPDAEPVTPEEA